MMNYRNIAIVLITGFICLTTSCKETPPVEELVCETAEVISFQEKIVPILDASCNNEGCHNTGFVAGDFTNFEGVLEKVMDGSLLLRLEDGTMPPITPLSHEQLQAIACWLADGHPNN